HADLCGDSPDEETLVGENSEKYSTINSPKYSWSTSLTETGAPLGTSAYMAPEQFEDAKHVDVRADVYSFGVMLFEMINGDRPFKARHWSEYSALHQSEPPPPLRSGNRALDCLVANCLAKDPQRRLQDFREVRSELGAIFEQVVHEP